MKIEFAESRPSGDFALVLPSTGSTRPGVSSLGDKAKIEAALERQKFDGDSGSSAELFIEEEGASRRLLVVGLGKDSLPADANAAELSALEQRIHSMLFADAIEEAAITERIIA